jgi:hypothetical protein
MRRWIVPVLATAVLLLLGATLVHGYRIDQSRIRMFEGTGIAGKVDVVGPMPHYLSVEGLASKSVKLVAVNADGSFVARLGPGRYRFRLPGRTASATVEVSGGRCTDLILDFRLPSLVLVVPGEGWPVPAVVGS